VFLYAYLNASYETGYVNPIDQAVRIYKKLDISSFKKLDEIPYDFVRKRMSVLVSKDNRHLMVTKGALANVFAICSSAETPEGTVIDITVVQQQIGHRFEELSGKGFRTLGMAYRDVGSNSSITKEHEAEESVEEGYYFVAKIDDQFIKSESFGFTYPLESYFEALGSSTEVSTAILAFRAKEHFKTFMVVPAIHPGPFRNLGSSNLPNLIQKSLEENLI
jgi:hypothetical protein